MAYLHMILPLNKISWTKVYDLGLHITLHSLTLCNDVIGRMFITPIEKEGKLQEEEDENIGYYCGDPDLCL